MIRRDQFVGAVVWLSALDPPLAIGRPRGQVFRPVHPVNSGVDVVLIARADFQDACNPLVLGPLPGTVSNFGTILVLNTGVVGHVDESFAEILGTID